MENFTEGEGATTIYARVRLDEYMEIGVSGGEATPLVAETSREDVSTWTTRLPGTCLLYTSWPEEDCFKAIDADQNFYIDKDGKLVILFEEYEVAPGSIGAPQFTVEPEVLQSILRQPSLLIPVGKESE